MKKILKITGLLLAVVALLLAGTALWIHFSGIPKYETVKFDYKVEVTPEKVARGKKLALTLCANCHMNTETGLLTGQLMKDAPPEFGIIRSANITQDKTFGIGNYTDAELVYLLRTGIKKNGQYAPPYMAKLPHMADSDIESIIAFLRSDDRMVAATSVEDKPCEPSLLSKVLCRTVFKPLEMPKEKIAIPDTNDLVTFGRYLAINLECFTCHSADFKKMNIMEPELSAGFMGGGNVMLTMEGEHIVTRNISPDKETGIGSWSEEKFVRALKYGIKDGEPSLRYPMLPYVHLTDYEAKAIYAYLKTVPPIKNDVKQVLAKQ